MHKKQNKTKGYRHTHILPYPAPKVEQYFIWNIHPPLIVTVPHSTRFSYPHQKKLQKKCKNCKNRLDAV